MALIDDIKTHLINDKGKINPWVSREPWIKKHGHETLIKKIHDEVNSNSLTIRDKIICIIHYKSIIPKCLSCGNETKYYASYKKFAQYCSIECEHISEERSNIGKKNINPQKMMATFKEKWAVDNPMLLDGAKEKLKQTCMRRYGVDNGSKTNAARKKISEKTKGKPKKKQIPSKILDSIFDEHINEKIPITTLSLRRGMSSSTMFNTLKRRGYKTQIFSGSFVENILANEIEKLGVKIERNRRDLIAPKEIDIYIPEYKIAIEVNGIYWHNSERHEKLFFINKTKACTNKDITLLHFYDTEIQHSLKKVMSIITNKIKRNKLRIFARNCKIKKIQPKHAKNFYDENHIQNGGNYKLNFGLFHDDGLVACMSFSKSSYKKGVWELKRFCCNNFTSIVGGFSRLLKAGMKEINSDIISYVDRRFYDGRGYTKIGFRQIGASSPNYFYFNKKEYKLESRIKFQKHKLHEILTTFDPNLSEAKNMKNNNYLKIYDCGNLIFMFSKD